MSILLPFVCALFGRRTVGNNIDDVTDLVLLEVGRERDHSLLLEIPGEAASSQRAVAIPFLQCLTYA